MRLSCYSPFLPPLAVLLLLLPSTIVAAATEQWIFPDSSYRPTYNYVDTLNCSWATDYPNAYLVIWCGPPDFTSFTACSNTSVPSTGSQTVSLDCNGAGACHAEVYAENKPSTPRGTSFAINSGAWYINHDTTRKPTTWSLETSPNTTSSSTTTSTSPATSVSSATSVNSTAPASAPTSTGEAAAPSGGLSTGASAGIGVGVSVGVLLFAVVAFLIFRTRRRRRRTDKGDGAQDLGSHTELMELKAADKAELKGVYEVGDAGAHELDAVGGNILEMRGTDVQTELDGTSAVGGTKGGTGYGRQ